MNIPKYGGWKRIDHKRLHSKVHMDHAKRSMSQFLKVVEKSVGSKARYLTDKTKGDFVEAALRITKNDQKAQKALLEYALQQYTQNPIYSAVVKALMIAVPLSIVGGMMLHKWWIDLLIYLSERYEIEWITEEEAAELEASGVSGLNPRMLPTTATILTSAKPVTSGSTSPPAEKKWFHRIGSWFGSSSADSVRDSPNGIDNSGKGESGSVVPSPLRVFSEGEYESEVGQLLQKVEESLKQSETERFSEEERAAILQRLAVILFSEVSESDRHLALERYTSVVQYGEYWREFYQRELLPTRVGSVSDRSSGDNGGTDVVESISAAVVDDGATTATTFNHSNLVTTSEESEALSEVIDTSTSSLSALDYAPSDSLSPIDIDIM